MTRALRPTSLGEALKFLADPELSAVCVAGGTDLMVVDQATGRVHKSVVDLLRLPELKGIQEEQGVIDIGAATTFTELRSHPTIRRHLPLLARAAATIGGWQIQNRATLGGNIANASPAGDALPPLLALNAELVLEGLEGARRLAYTSMHRGYRKTALQRGELITRIRIPIPPPQTVQAFKKVGTREAQAISKVVVAFQATPRAGKLRGVRIAAGSVAPTPIPLNLAAAACEGHPPNRSTAEEAGRAALLEARPIDDLRSTKTYRRFVLKRVVRRMVLDCAPT